ncbi:glycosyltransferase [Flavobacterium sp. J27]|uniref:glycosyltransferase n=1 Tax=Flavobacterium sp. J27 TaxID=2060419 RepID=UPI0010308438|nr:glycosyltransferase [Flavobacterium sp. J27]
MKKVLVISSAPLISKQQKYFAYSPYEKEMQLWAKYTDEIYFCCPIWQEDRGILNSEVIFKIHRIIPLKEFDIQSFSSVTKAIFYSVINFWIILKAIKNANHIHLRCPGNMTLIACFAQIFYPKKIKTAKYAGNWDPNSKQPVTYKLQKWILSNTFLTRNMQVLVYGQWKDQSKNIKSFFTATYKENEIPQNEIPQNVTFKEQIKMLFVGTLSSGKQPLYALQIILELKKKGFPVVFELYGEGNERAHLQNFIEKHALEEFVKLKGNQPKDKIEKAYQEHHFLILPSKSEGWPKVVAEAMFWGCLPIATKISCVPYMLDNGNRGILITGNLQEDVFQIEQLITRPLVYIEKINEGKIWSREFTLDKFESEIKNLIQ